LDRFKRRVREITQQAKGVSIETTMAELAPYMRGWRSYFGFCETPQELVQLTRWVRLRLRVALWRQWKNTPSSSGRTSRAGGTSATSEQHRWQQPWPPIPRAGPSPLCRASNAYFTSLGLPTLHKEC
jgi:RNA-directed DNA polymerase